MVVFRYAICTIIIISMEHTYASLAKDKSKLLSELGFKFNLSFSSHFVLGSKLIALDGIKKSLLVSDASNKLNQPCIIELDKVSAVSIKKSYGTIQAGELKIRKFEEFLKRIDLQFEYHDNDEPVVLTFYDSEINEPRHVPALDRNAKNWQMILSNLIVSQAHQVNKIIAV